MSEKISTEGSMGERRWRRKEVEWKGRDCSNGGFPVEKVMFKVSGDGVQGVESGKCSVSR